jgi:hypothetical protein
MRQSERALNSHRSGAAIRRRRGQPLELVDIGCSRSAAALPGALAHARDRRLALQPLGLARPASPRSARGGRVWRRARSPRAASWVRRLQVARALLLALSPLRTFALPSARRCSAAAFCSAVGPGVRLAAHHRAHAAE